MNGEWLPLFSGVLITLVTVGGSFGVAILLHRRESAKTKIEAEDNDAKLLHQQALALRADALADRESARILHRECEKRCDEIERQLSLWERGARQVDGLIHRYRTKANNVITRLGGKSTDLMEEFPSIESLIHTK